MDTSLVVFRLEVIKEMRKYAFSEVTEFHDSVRR